MALPGGLAVLKVTELQIERSRREDDIFTHRFSCKGVIDGLHLLIEGGLSLKNVEDEEIKSAQVTITHVGSGECSQGATLIITEDGVGHLQ